MSPSRRWLLPCCSLRGRLLLAALLVEGVMLTLMVGNSLRLLEDRMEAQAQAHASQIAPVLNAALVAPLAQRDDATVQAVLEESNSVRGVEYLAVVDNAGRIVASSGWPAGQPLPPAVERLELALDGDDPRHHVVHPIRLSGQRLGTLHFGFDIRPIAAARRELLMQAVAIAIVEVLLSAALLAALGYWITRRLSTLTDASIAVAHGNLAPGPIPEGDDELGRLGTAFNTMSRAISERLTQVTEANDQLAQVGATLERDNARMTALLSAMQLGVLFVDESARVVYANPALLVLWGLEAADAAVGVPYATLRERMNRRLLDPASARDGDAPVRELELRGGTVLTQGCFAVRSAPGRRLGDLYLFTDVTEARRTARQLVAARDAAEAAGAAKATFLATMSHEIRTPMNGIIAMTDLALSTPLTPAQRLYLDTVRVSAHTLLAIVSDILDFSKIDANRMELECVAFDPAQLLAETVEVFRAAAVAKGLQLQLHLPAPLPAGVLGDPTRVRQVVSNLVSNAVKFTAAGSVRVEARVDDAASPGTGLVIAVHDTGSGIDPDCLPRIFDPFTQADSSTTRRFGGTGLGLSIVARLAALMGGRVDARSTPGEGAVFTVRLPLPRADAPPPAAHAPLPHAPVTAARILVAEDNEVNQLVIESVLQSLGHECVIAADGMQAVALWRTAGPFDLVLMDMLMPELDGIEATRRIRAAERRSNVQRATPIVALTANATAADRSACSAAGMDGFLSKPITIESLQAALQRHLVAEAATAAG